MDQVDSDLRPRAHVGSRARWARSRSSSAWWRFSGKVRRHLSRRGCSRRSTPSFRPPADLRVFPARRGTRQRGDVWESGSSAPTSFLQYQKLYWTRMFYKQMGKIRPFERRLSTFRAEMEFLSPTLVHLFERNSWSDSFYSGQAILLSNNNIGN